MHTNIRYLGLGLALAAIVLPLAACSSGNIAGASAYGTGRQQIAELPNSASYTADTALAEARSHFKNSNFGYSAALYKRVVELTPNDPEGYIGLGASYDQLGRFDLSDRVYASLYKLTGGTARYYNNVGYSYMLRGNLPEALRNFRSAQKLDPNNPLIANNIAMLENAAAARKS
jgi:Flp pilus assembly protein TadD